MISRFATALWQFRNVNGDAFSEDFLSSNVMAFSQASVFGRRICTESKNLKIQLAIVDLVSNRIAAPFKKINKNICF